MPRPPERKFYRVVKRVVTESEYEVIARDRKGAEDAVYWRDSSGRPTGDAVKMGEPRSKVEYDVRELADSTTGAWCIHCRHHESEHNPEDGSCYWAGCLATGAACVTDEARAAYFQPHPAPPRQPEASA